jgi:hypothetical protein
MQKQSGMWYVLDSPARSLSNSSTRSSGMIRMSLSSQISSLSLIQLQSLSRSMGGVRRSIVSCIDH